jgi:hypothetical protein
MIVSLEAIFLSTFDDQPEPRRPEAPSPRRPSLRPDADEEVDGEQHGDHEPDRRQDRTPPTTGTARACQRIDEASRRAAVMMPSMRRFAT